MEAEAAIYPFGSTTFSTFQPPFSIFITAKEISWSNRRLPPLPGLSFVQPFSYDDPPQDVRTVKNARNLSDHRRVLRSISF